MKKLLLFLTLFIPLIGFAQNSADLEKMGSANTSYTTRTSTNGWKATNACLISVDNIVAPTLNGKVGSLGTISSPDTPLTGGVGKISFKYAYTYSEGKNISARIDILQNNIVVATETLSRDDATQNQIYTYESKDFNVDGNFKILITNLGPAKNSSSNKDRLSIWNLTWTSFPNEEDNNGDKNDGDKDNPGGDVTGGSGTVTFDFVKEAYGLTRGSDYITKVTTITESPVNMTLTGGSEWRLWGDGMRAYTTSNKVPKLTLSVPNGKITGMSFTGSGTNFKVDGQTSDIPNNSWTGSVDEITFVFTGTSGKPVETITVTYEITPKGPQDYTALDEQNDVTIAYNGLAQLNLGEAHPDITWSYNPDGIVTIDKDGLITAERNKYGSTTVTASWDADDDWTASTTNPSFKVTVSEPSRRAYEDLDGFEKTIFVGETVTLPLDQPHPEFEFGHAHIDPEGSFTFDQETGEIKALAEGLFGLSLTWEESDEWNKGSAEISVTAQKRTYESPFKESYELYESATLDLLGEGEHPVITYTTTPEAQAVINIDENGTLTALAVGTVEVTASWGDATWATGSASFTVKVTEAPVIVELKESFGDNGSDINDSDHFEPLLPSGTYSSNIVTSKSKTTGITYAVTQGIITQYSNGYFLQLKKDLGAKLEFTTPSNCIKIRFTLGNGSAASPKANISENDNEAELITFSNDYEYEVKHPGKSISIATNGSAALRIAALTYILNGNAKEQCDEPALLLNGETALDNGAYLYGEDSITLVSDTEGAEIKYIINGGETNTFNIESPITFSKNDDYVIETWAEMPDDSYANSGRVTYTVHYRKVNPMTKYQAILVTDISEIEPNNQYLIVGPNKDQNSYNVMTNDCVNAFNVVQNAEMNEDGTEVLFTEQMSKVVFENDGEYWHLLLDNGDYVATAYTQNDNYATTVPEKGDNTKATISMNTDNTFSISFAAGGNFRYNPSNPRFACYGGSSQNDAYLYRLYVKDDPIIAIGGWSFDKEETEANFEFETSHANFVSLSMLIECEDENISSYVIRLGDNRWEVETDGSGFASFTIPYVEYSLTTQPITVRGTVDGEKTIYYDAEIEEFDSSFENEEFGHTHSMTDAYKYWIYDWDSKTKNAKVDLIMGYTFEHNGHEDAHFVVTNFSIDHETATVEYDNTTNTATIKEFANLYVENTDSYEDAIRNASFPKIKATTTISYPVVYLLNPPVILDSESYNMRRRVQLLEDSPLEFATKVYTSTYFNEIDAPGGNFTVSGIEAILGGEGTDGDVMFFNMQGVRVSGENLLPGAYIRVEGASAQKVLVK